MVLIVLLRRIKENLPGPLLAMLLTSAVVAALKLDQAGVRVVSEMPQGLPGMVDFVNIDLNLVSNLIPGALAIAAIGLVY